MAQISYSESMQNAVNSENQVGFFSLPKDGDEAIVRFICDSIDDFVILTRHDVGQGKNYRTVNCLRTPHDPIDACPFCAAGLNLKQSFYIHLIQYIKSEDGSITPVPRIWERSTSYATKLKGYIENYGPLTSLVCKIIRHGTGLNTEYEIIPNLAPTIYPESMYPCAKELFEGYRVVGRAVMEKSAEDMDYYLLNGMFPEVEQSNAPIVTSEPVMDNFPPQVYNQPQGMYSQPQQPVQQQQYAPVNVPNPNPAYSNSPQMVQRPIRRYQ